MKNLLLFIMVSSMLLFGCDSKQKPLAAVPEVSSSVHCTFAAYAFEYVEYTDTIKVGNFKKIYLSHKDRFNNPIAYQFKWRGSQLPTLQQALRMVSKSNPNRNLISITRVEKIEGSCNKKDPSTDFNKK